MAVALAALQQAVARNCLPARPAVIVEDRTDRPERGPANDAERVASLSKIPGPAISASGSNGKSEPVGSRT
jgi:hypothetical protein